MSRGRLFPLIFLALFIHRSTAQTLEFSGYLGGIDFEHIRDVTTDAAGNIYVTGGTNSPDFPVTGGAFQTTHNPGTPDDPAILLYDVFVTKLDPDGNIIWSTFLGGRNYDRAYGIEVDEAGHVYVSGRAGNGFPVTPGAFQTAFQGGQAAAFYGPQDGFVAKLSPDGSALEWASYFGTNDPRIVRDLAVDTAGNVYLASGYSSGSFTSSVAGQFLNGPIGGQDAVLAKVAPDGSSISWARYLGGTGWDSDENSVRLGPSGDPYFLFTTESSGIATSGAYDMTYGGSQDFFVCRVNAPGTVLWGTYLGGSDNESTETHELAVDSFGNAYVSGPTKSTNYPVTQGAFQSVFIGPAGFNDIVVSKLSPDGSQLLASTFLGGNGADRTEGIDVLSDGRVFITGTTTSTNFPLTANAFQTSLIDARDAIAVVLSADLQSLDHSTFIGSSGPDYGRCATVDALGNIILAGEANGTGWPLAGAGFAFSGGTGDAVLAKFSIQITTQLIENVRDAGISVYPNPGVDQINIDLVEDHYEIGTRITDVLGRTVHAGHHHQSRSISMDVKDLLPGNYFIELELDRNEVEYFQWIKIDGL
jgi:hypothetical protein